VAARPTGRLPGLLHPVFYLAVELADRTSSEERTPDGGRGLVSLDGAARRPHQLSDACRRPRSATAGGRVESWMIWLAIFFALVAIVQTERLRRTREDALEFLQLALEAERELALLKKG
jgi:hypothetical protein